MSDFEIEKVRLIDDGSLDTVVSYDSTIVRFSPETAAPYRDQDGSLDFYSFLDDYRDDILDAVASQPKQKPLHPWRKRQRKTS